MIPPGVRPDILDWHDTRPATRAPLVGWPGVIATFISCEEDRGLYIGSISALYRLYIGSVSALYRLYIGSTSASPRACPVRGCRRRGTRFDRVDEGFPGRCSSQARRMSMHMSPAHVCAKCSAAQKRRRRRRGSNFFNKSYGPLCFPGFGSPDPLGRLCLRGSTII